MKVKNLKVFGDSQIIVDQVRKRIHCNYPHLVRYRHEVWDLIDNLFLAFNIQFLQIEENKMSDSLFIATSNFKSPQNQLLKYEVEV